MRPRSSPLWVPFSCSPHRQRLPSPRGVNRQRTRARSLVRATSQPSRAGDAAQSRPSALTREPGWGRLPPRGHRRGGGDVNTTRLTFAASAALLLPSDPASAPSTGGAASTVPASMRCLLGNALRHKPLTTRIPVGTEPTVPGAGPHPLRGSCRPAEGRGSACHSIRPWVAIPAVRATSTPNDGLDSETRTAKQSGDRTSPRGRVSRRRRRALAARLRWLKTHRVMPVAMARVGVRSDGGSRLDGERVCR